MKSRETSTTVITATLGLVFLLMTLFGTGDPFLGLVVGGGLLVFAIYPYARGNYSIIAMSVGVSFVAVGFVLALYLGLSGKDYIRLGDEWLAAGGFLLLSLTLLGFGSLLSTLMYLIRKKRKP